MYIDCIAAYLSTRGLGPCDKVSKAALCDQMISGAGRSRCVRFLFYFRDIAKRHFRVHMGAAAVSGAKRCKRCGKKICSNNKRNLNRNCPCAGRGRIAKRTGGVGMALTGRLQQLNSPWASRRLSSTSIVRHIAWIALRALVADKALRSAARCACSPKEGCGICSMQQALRYESAACAELVDDDSFAVGQCRLLLLICPSSQCT